MHADERRWNGWLVARCQRYIVGTVISLGFLLGFTGVASAQMPEQTNEFRRIEQPIGLKTAVTLGGLGLIGAELWWFLFSKTRSQKAENTHGVQELTINVDGGYAPDRIIVKSGQLVRLNFLRKDPSSCLEKVLIPDFHIAQDLALNNITPIEFIPEKPGQYQFTCGMNMFRGVVEVQ
ncbi:cupredoxin domain-containing protein [Aliterella atlantica]|uniref:cupredoxin domain-containing protein n=1 Tax=Aliterella atlantica TaxID=1827278 RepID=UPI0005D2FE8E|nr:cupredoxin domain-containing protein [Aliterella atlantica]